MFTLSFHTREANITEHEVLWMLWVLPGKLQERVPVEEVWIVLFQTVYVLHLAGNI